MLLGSIDGSCAHGSHLSDHVQNQVSKQDAQLQILQRERDALAAQLEGMRSNLDTAASLAEEQVSLCLDSTCVVSAFASQQRGCGRNHMHQCNSTDCLM